MRRIAAEAVFHCCEKCGEDAVDRMLATNQGYTFFDVEDMTQAVKSGVLYLAYGSKDEADLELNLSVGDRVYAELRRGKLNAIWKRSSNTYIEVMLGPRDIQWMHDLLEDHQQVVKNRRADNFRLQRFFNNYRGQTCRQKNARDVITKAICTWNTRRKCIEDK